MMIQTDGTIKCGVFGLCFFLGIAGLSPFLNASSIDQKDPIKETQTTPVPVTDELLNRDGESGPASPSFKLKDSADFFSHEPYGLDEELGEIQEEQEEEPGLFGGDWLFWEKDEEKQEESDPEPLEEE